MAIKLAGNVALPQVGFLRKIGALAVAGTLLLMPLFYFAVIGAVLGLLVWLPIGGGGLGMPAWLVGVLELVGLVLLAGLVKPLIEPRVRTAVERPLDVNREPALRGLLELISQQIKAPLPASVHVECSTQLTFHPRHKRLTIGLPLLACLSAQQFAGAAAGQFALYRSGANCGVTNLIRRINLWLWRSVYGKSRFDQWLTIVGERPHFHLAKLLLPLAALKFVSQAVLFVPMFIANTVAAQIVRQADLDADLVAARLIGFKALADLLQRQELIDFTWEGVVAELDYLYRDQSLPDSLPNQLALRMLDMTPELSTALSETVNRSEDRPFDSQLSRTERLASIRPSAPAAGVLDERSPATALLNSYPELARKLTWDFYVERFGPDRLKTALRPVATPVEAG